MAANRFIDNDNMAKKYNICIQYDTNKIMFRNIENSVGSFSVGNSSDEAKWISVVKTDAYKSIKVDE